MSDQIPTTERLAQALEAKNDPRLASMITFARQGLYDDFKSPLAYPLVTLVGHLRDMGHHDLAQRVLDGEFDATQEEGMAWMNSPEGQRLMIDLIAGR